MNDASFLRAPTIMQAFHDAGAKVAVVTAKDKLRAMLGKGLDMSTRPRHRVLFGEGRSRRPCRPTASAMCLKRIGKPLPEVYSADLSEFVMAAGVSILKTRAPGPDVSLHHRLRAAQGRAGLGDGERVLRHDGPLCRRARRGRRRAGAHRRSRHERQAPRRTASRTSSISRTSPTNGSARTSRGCCCRSPIRMWCITARSAPSRRSICPRRPTCRALLTKLRAVEGVELAIDSARKPASASSFRADRFGDVVVISTIHKVLGTAREKHDLSGLTEPLRSHGGLTEQVVPMIANRKVTVRAGTPAAQFRCVRCRAQPRGLRIGPMNIQTKPRRPPRGDAHCGQEGRDRQPGRGPATPIPAPSSVRSRPRGRSTCARPLRRRRRSSRS